MWSNILQGFSIANGRKEYEKLSSMSKYLLNLEELNIFAPTMKVDDAYTKAVMLDELSNYSTVAKQQVLEQIIQDEPYYCIREQTPIRNRPFYKVLKRSIISSEKFRDYLK